MNISPSVRHGSALVGSAGVLLFVGCVGSPTANEAEGTAGADGTGSTPSSPSSGSSSGSGTGSGGSAAPPAGEAEVAV